jgi:hypothetical protein
MRTVPSPGISKKREGLKLSDKLAKHIELELLQLQTLLEEHHLLIEACISRDPDTIERSALAAMLHSFYTGIENIFKRIAIEFDGELPKGKGDGIDRCFFK